MENKAARFMLSEIHERIARRRRPIERIIQLKLNKITDWVNMDLDPDKADSEFITEMHYKMTEPRRIKW